MIVIRILMLAAFLFLFPFLLGAPWTTLLPKKNRYRLLSCFPIGFFVEIAIFQLLEVPIAFLHLPFTLLCWMFAIVVVVACIYSGWYFGRNKPFSVRLSGLNSWELFYLIVFMGLLAWQLYNGLVRDTTYWSYDDSVYVTYAADTIRYNTIQTINPYTGIATAFNSARALQGWLYYPAFLSQISTVHVTVMGRTILETYDILIAYFIYAYMASVLFSRKEEGLVFLIFLSLLHVFGWYSQYSVTFRLLGPNYQGKAVLAVSFLPLFFTILIQVLGRRYSIRCGILLLLLSVAASSFTMFGAASVILNTTLVVGLSLFCKRKRWNHLLYIPWSICLPIFYIGVYFLCRLPLL